MVSSYMPDVEVHIAFDGGVRVPMADWTWTDVSTYVELDQGISVQIGRQDERSQADANQLSLVLDNSDGRFTFGRSSSPYYPNVKLDRPIRVRATPVDGSAQVEFVGFINEWPLEWDGTDATAHAAITASSRLSRLGLNAALSNIVSQEILADSPAAYYTLGEPADSTQANDSSGNGGDPLTLAGDPSLPVVFGNATGPGTDGLTAAEFAGGQYLATTPVPTVSGQWSIEFFFRRDGLPAADEDIVYTNAIEFFIRTDGKVGVNGAALVSTDSYADGETHHVAATFDVAPALIRKTLYVDGVEVDTDTTSTSPPTEIAVGGSPLVSAGFTGTVAHVAFFPGQTLSAARVADHAAAGLTGFEGESADTRLERYAGYAGIDSAELNAEACNTLLDHIDSTDQQVVELMRKVEVSEGGVLFDDRDGTLAFHARDHRYTTTSSFTLSMAEQEVEATYAPRVDRTYILNDVTTKNLDGSVTARKVDTTSRTDYGQMAASIETADQDDNGPLMAASWMVYKFKDPRERTATLTVDTTAQVGKTPNSAAVMAANVGDKVTVSGRPSQAASSSVDYFIEGYARVFVPESVVTTFNVSPSSPEDQVLVIGDSTRGVIGTNPIAF